MPSQQFHTATVKHTINVQKTVVRFLFAMPCRPTWMGNDTIVNAVVPGGVGPAPVKPPSAIGPKVQDNTIGKKAQARTYQDLLKDAYDEDTFEYYTNTELVAVQVTWSC